MGVTAPIDHPIPMQLSTSVGAAAKQYAVPPKIEEEDSNVTSSLNSVSDTIGNINASSQVAKQCMIVEGGLHGHPATILIDSGAQSSHISCDFVKRHQIPTTASPR